MLGSFTKIEYGETISYKEEAKILEMKKHIGLLQMQMVKII